MPKNANNDDSEVVVNRYEIIPEALFQADEELGIHRGTDEEVFPRGMYDQYMSYGLDMYVGGVRHLWNEQMCADNSVASAGLCLIGTENEKFTGDSYLNPDRMEQGTWIDVGPITGRTMRGGERLQGSIKIDRGLLFPMLGQQSADEGLGTVMYHPLFSATKGGSASYDQIDDFELLMYTVVGKIGMLST